MPCFQTNKRFGVLTRRLELSLAIKTWRFRIFPNHTQETAAFCRHIYHFLHASCSRTHSNDLDMPLTPEASCLGVLKEVPACSKTILVPLQSRMFLFCLVRFSLHAASICGATLPYELLEGILELRTPFSYKAPWRQAVQALKCSNTFKGLGLSHLNFFLSQ